MNKKVCNTVFTVLSIVLLVISGIYICMSLFNNFATTTPLAITMGCVAVSNLIFLVRQLHHKEK